MPPDEKQELLNVLQLPASASAEQIKSRFKQISAFLDAHLAGNPILAGFVQEAAEYAEDTYYSLSKAPSPDPIETEQYKQKQNNSQKAQAQDPDSTAAKSFSKDPACFSQPWWDKNARQVYFILSLILIGLLLSPHSHEGDINTIKVSTSKTETGNNVPTATTSTSVPVVTANSAAAEIACISPKVLNIYLGRRKDWRPPDYENTLLTPTEAARTYIQTYYSLLKEGRQDLAFQAHSRSWQLSHNKSEFQSANSAISPTFAGSASELAQYAVIVRIASNDGARFTIQNKYFSGKPGLTQIVTANPGSGWQIEDEQAVFQAAPQDTAESTVVKYLQEIAKSNFVDAYNYYLDDTLKKQLSFSSWKQLVSTDYPNLDKVVDSRFVHESNPPDPRLPDSASVSLDLSVLRPANTQTTSSALQPNDSSASSSSSPTSTTTTPGLDALYGHSKPNPFTTENRSTQNKVQLIDLINNNGRWAIFKISDADPYLQIASGQVMSGETNKVRVQRVSDQESSTSSDSLVKTRAVSDNFNPYQTGSAPDLFGSLLLLAIVFVAFGKVLGVDAQRLVSAFFQAFIAVLSLVPVVISKILVPITKALFVGIGAAVQASTESTKANVPLAPPKPPDKPMADELPLYDVILLKEKPPAKPPLSPPDILDKQITPQPGPAQKIDTGNTFLNQFTQEVVVPPAKTAQSKPQTPPGPKPMNFGLTEKPKPKPHKGKSTNPYDDPPDIEIID